MRFILKKSSNWAIRDEVEINSLEELIAFQKTVDFELIVGNFAEENETDNFYIEVYDGYRE